MTHGVVAVVDCGRARWKMKSWVQRDGVLESRSSRTVESGKTGQEEVVLDLATQCRAWLASEGAEQSDVVGAAAFRDYPELVEVVESVLGIRPRVLTPSEEAEALGIAICGGGSRDAMAVDLGGGSVQAISLNPVSFIGSAPLGSYSIEERFGLPQGSAPEAYKAVRNALSREVSDLVNGYQAKLVVAGSNTYKRFFEGIESWSGLPGRVGTATAAESSSLSIDLIELAYEGFQRLPPDQFEAVMPSLPGFMFGADKALLVLLEVMRATGADRAVGTDMGVSDGLALALVHRSK